MKSQIRVSASRLKTLWSCSLLFYYQEVLNLPDSTHWKTKVGTIVHLVFECIMRKDRPSRLRLFQEIILGKISKPSSSASIFRFIRWQIYRFGISDKVTVEEIDELLRVAFLGIRPYFSTLNPDGVLTYTPPENYYNEQRFQITLPSGATISGVIDLLLIWHGRSVCIDLKTQAKKFSRCELPSNVQAILYQLATYRQHGLIPTIDFILVRHAPTDRTPDKHIQRVEPASVLALDGLTEYIDHIYNRIKQFSLDDALISPCQDEGFCLRVCTHYAPHPYWVVAKKTDPKGLEPLSSHLSLDEATKACDTKSMIILERHHPGCIAKWVG